MNYFDYKNKGLFGIIFIISSFYQIIFNIFCCGIQFLLIADNAVVETGLPGKRNAVNPESLLFNFRGSRRIRPICILN